MQGGLSASNWQDASIKRRHPRTSSRSLISGFKSNTHLTPAWVELQTLACRSPTSKAPHREKAPWQRGFFLTLVVWNCWRKKKKKALPLDCSGSSLCELHCTCHLPHHRCLTHPPPHPYITWAEPASSSALKDVDCERRTSVWFHTGWHIYTQPSSLLRWSFKSRFS